MIVADPRLSGADVLAGLRAPLRVLAQARVAGEPLVRYRRLVRWQLLLVTLIVSALSPLVVGALDVGQRKAPDLRYGVVVDGQRNVHIGRQKKKKKKTPHIEVVRGSEEKKPDEDDAEEEIAGAEFLAAHAPGLIPLWIALVALYGTWSVVEWLISALYREHNDRLTEALARAAGLPIREDPRSALPPRVRLDIRWVMRRLWRQVQGSLVFATGAPFFLLASLVPGLAGRLVYGGVIGLWGIYWLMVTTAAKSDLAWSEPAQRRSWYLRGWSTLTTRVPGFRWALPRLYGRAWSRLTDKMHRAEELVEQRPSGLAGASIVRLLSNVPILSVFLRPLVPLSVSLVLLDRVPARGSGRAGLRPG